MMVAGYEYTVIGVLAKKKQNGSYGSGPDNTQLFTPYSAMARDFPPTDPGIERGFVNNIVVEPVSPDLHEQASMRSSASSQIRHHYDPEDKEALWVWDTLDGAKFTDRIFSVMTFFFGAVALLTLALGGIGVMNIMLVAVTERTAEIGVRKALGATAVDIRRQFLVESAIITIVSGAAGLTIGVGTCLLHAADSPPRFRAASRDLSDRDHLLACHAHRHHALRRNLSRTARRQPQPHGMPANGVTMNLGEIIRQSIDSLLRNRLRSSLTMLGIVWGLVTVVLLLSYGRSLGREVMNGFLGLGDNVIMVWGGQTSMQAGGERAGKRIKFRDGDTEAVRDTVPFLKAVSSESDDAFSFKYGAKVVNIQSKAIEYPYGGMRRLNVAEGRYFEPADFTEHRQVVIFGAARRPEALQRIPSRRRIGEHRRPRLPGHRRPAEQDSGLLQ